MPAGRTASVVFLGNSSQLNAELARIEMKLKALSDVSTEQNAKMAASSEAAAGRMGKAYDEGTTKAAGGLHKLSALGANFGLPMMGSLDSVGKKLDETTTKSGKLASVMSEMGKVTLTAGLAGFAAAAYEGVKGAEKFQTSVATISASAGISEKAARSLGSTMLDTMGKSTFSGAAMASAYGAVAGQLRLTEGTALSNAQAMTVMRSATDLAEASQIDLGTATSALANVMQAYHMGVTQAASASNVLFNTSKALAVPVASVAQAVDRLHGRLGELAPSLRDTSTLMVEMAQHGITGSRGVMMVNTAMQTLVGQSKKTTEVLQAMGVNVFDASGHFIGLQSVIQQLQPKFAAMTQQQQLFAAQTIFGKGASQAMLQVIQSGVPAYTAATQAVTKHNAVQQAADMQTKTLHGEMETLKATISDLANKFGLFLIPKLQAVGTALASVIQWFQKHQTAALALAGVIGGPLAVAVGVFATQKLASMISWVGQSIAAIGRFAASVATAAAGLVTKFTTIGTASRAMETEVVASDEGIVASADATAAGVDTALGSTGVGLVIVGLGVAVTELATHWSQAMSAMKTIVETMAQGAIDIINKLSGAIKSLTLGLVNLGQIGNVLQTPQQQVAGMANSSAQNFMNTPFGTPTSPSGKALPGYSATGGPWTGQGGVVTPASFAASTLSRLGLPTSSAAIRDFTAWEKQEGGNWANSAKYNPLNTTMGEPGAGNTGSQGNIKVYTSWAQGLAATVATLKNYPGILAALKAGASPAAFSGAVASSPWGTGAINASGQSLSQSQINAMTGGGNAAIGSLINATATGKAKKVTYGPSANVENMLTMAEELAGTPYTKAGHASAFNETVAQIKKFGTDCSGLVSVLLKEGISGIRAAQTTQGLPTAAGLAPGAGKYVTVYDRHTGAVDQEHTFIEILGKYFEEGGVLQNHAGQMTKAQVAQEFAGGGFEAFHPTAAALNTAVAGGKTSAFSAAAAQAALQQAIDAFITGLNKAANALISTYTALEQSGTVRTLTKALGVSTGGSITNTSTSWVNAGNPRGDLHEVTTTTKESVGAALKSVVEGIKTGKVISDLNAGNGPSGIDTLKSGGITSLLSRTEGASPQGKAFNSLVANLIAAGQKNEANALVAAHKAAMATLAQEIYAEQVLKDGELLNLQATQLNDQTKLMADTDAQQLVVTKAQQQKVIDAMNAEVTAIKDMTQTVQDQFAGVVQAIQDATQAMADNSDAVVAGIQDTVQTRVDILGERGLYGLNLIAQQQTVQLDIMKAGFDQQIAAAKMNLDQVTASVHVQESSAQLILDQVTTQQDALVALVQQASDTVAISQNVRILTAQQHEDAVQLQDDARLLGPAQMAVDLGATLPKAQQDVLNGILNKAKGQTASDVAGATNAYQKVYDSAQGAINDAANAVTVATTNANQLIGAANATLVAVTGAGNAAIANANQGVTTITDTAAIAEAGLQGTIDVTKATASTQFAGSGLTVQIYGVPTNDAAAIADAFSWVARSVLPT